MKFTQSGYSIPGIIGQYREDLEQGHKLISKQKKVLTNLTQCRTVALGGHKARCNCCGSEKFFYNSCRDRHCPSCNGLKKEKWIAHRQNEALPVNYFHVVFTLPGDLNNPCLHYPALMYNLLFTAAKETIELFSKDHKYLGASTGMIAVLHTWGQNISLHPHIHCLVPGVGIIDYGKLKYPKKSKGKFLFPVKAMSKVFRGKFTDGLIELEKEGKIKLPVSFDINQKHLHPLYRRKWVVFAKRPLQGSSQIVKYLGRYVNSIVISNYRIKSVENDKVTFSWFDYRTSKKRLMTLDATEFLHRFVLHVLPDRFVKVRHYGFLSNRNKKTSLNLLFELLGVEPPEKLKETSWFKLFEMFFGVSPFKCPKCKKGVMEIIAVIPPARDGPYDLSKIKSFN